MWIKACLNGARPAPASPADLAAEAVAAARAGAQAVHVHPRDPSGRESLAAGDIGAAVAAIRAARPGLPVGVSTGIWMTGGDARRRSALVASWVVRPDFASVNVHEDGFADLVRRLHAAGVEVEAGVWTPAGADALAGLPLLRVLVEIVGTPAAEAVRAADAILHRLDRNGYAGPRLLHGEEEACWPLVAHAGRLGLATRIGFEDTLVLPDGRPAPDNATLVRHARAVWSAANTDG